MIDPFGNDLLYLARSGTSPESSLGREVWKLFYGTIWGSWRLGEAFFSLWDERRTPRDHNVDEGLRQSGHDISLGTRLPCAHSALDSLNFSFVPSHSATRNNASTTAAQAWPSVSLRPKYLEREAFQRLGTLCAQKLSLNSRVESRVFLSDSTSNSSLFCSLQLHGRAAQLKVCNCSTPPYRNFLSSPKLKFSFGSITHLDEIRNNAISLSKLNISSHLRGRCHVGWVLAIW